jgi:formylglycine-generating enzyme required for sulfatase activity/predicted  nucleic acid-binding Zn-ribbon protein
MAKIVAGCKHCGHLFKIEELFEGIDVECPKCGKSVVVSKVADRDERGLPVFSEDMDAILDQIYRKAEQAEQADAVQQVQDMDQLEQMAETMEVDQETLRKAAEIKGETAVRKLQIKKSATKYRVTKPKKSKKKLVAVLIILALLIGGGVFAYTKWQEMKRFEKDAEELYKKASAGFDSGNFNEVLKLETEFKKKYSQSKIAQEMQKLVEFATTEKAAHKLMEEAEQLYEKGELDKALAKLDELLSKHSTSRLNSRAGDKKKLWLSQKALKDDERDLARAKELRTQGKLREAYEILKRIAGGTSTVAGEAKGLVELIEQYQREAKTRLDSGQEARAKKMFDTALTNFNEVLKEYPDSDSAPLAKKAIGETETEQKQYNQEMYSKHMAAGMRAMQQKNWQQAVREFQDALKYRPGDAVAAKQLAQARAKFNLTKNMIEIPAGKFTMGSDTGEMDERPSHNVSLSAYYISKHPVTNKEYKRFVDEAGHDVPYMDEEWAEPYNWKNGTYPAGKGDHPVVLVTYDDALAYCKWAGKRLPTEAEWERAARGQDGRTYPWGDHAPSNVLCNFASNERGTSNIGAYAAGASPVGALDMAGNVWEWCADSYDPGFYKQVNNTLDPLCNGATGLKVIRGGSWVNTANALRCTNRHSSKPDLRAAVIGFRTALDAK